MEASKKKPVAKPAPAAKMPAPKLSSGKYTFSKAECLRRYLSKKSNKCGKGISPAKKAEVRVFIATFLLELTCFILLLFDILEEG